MTISAPRCSCDAPLLMAIGHRCPIHGTQETKDELERLRELLSELGADPAGAPALEAARARIAARRAAA